MHRAGFILSLAHIGLSVYSDTSSFIRLFNFFAGMSVVFVGDGEGKENLHSFDGEQYLAALFKDDSSSS
jgi:hypothetical protein